MTPINSKIPEPQILTQYHTMKPILTRITQPELYYINNNKAKIAGPNPDLWGDCTGLSGDCTKLSGDCTNLRGDLDLAGITDAERAAGVNIAQLIK